MPAIVSARNLRKTFQGVQAVDGISFDIKEREFVTLLGPSGCGKTTTLRLVAGLEENDGGEIHFKNRPVSSPERRIHVPPEKRGIGMVFQSYAIWPHMTVFQNIAFPLRIRRLPKQQIKEKVDRVLKMFDLVELGPRLSTKLSGGQQQRVAIARALAVEPDLLLMDEPLSNLDAKLRERTRFELRELQRRTGIATLYVTHDQAEAMVLSDRIIVMNKGRIEQIGSAEEIYERPQTQFVSDFVGLANVFHVELIAPREPEGLRMKTRETGRELVCRASSATRDHSQRLALVRPENVRVCKSDEVSVKANIWPGKVESMAYLGESRDYFVRIDDALLRARTSAATVFQPGDSVFVVFAPADVILMDTASPQD